MSRIIKLAMRNFLTIFVLAFATLCFSQAPMVTIDVAGSYSGTYQSTLSDGTTETIIACMCSGQICYTITTPVVVPPVAYGCTDNIPNDVIGVGILVQIRNSADELLKEGIFLNYENVVDTSNIDIRNHVFIFQ